MIIALAKIIQEERGDEVIAFPLISGNKARFADSLPEWTRKADHGEHGEEFDTAWQ